jgi:hypothetical protein
MKKRILGFSMALVLIAVMALPMAVLAEDDITVVSGSIGASYSFNAPDNIVLGPLSATTYSDDDLSISATSNDLGATVDITVNDTASPNNPGYLTLGGADTLSVSKLDNEFQIVGGSQILADLTAEPMTLATAGSLTTGTFTINDFGYSQVVTANDLTKTSGTYSLTMTFTATFN